MLHITDYRGFQIFYNEETDKFQSTITEEVTSKINLSGVKKAIDEYYKSNEGFKPFKVFNFQYHDLPQRVLTITGISKANKFLFTGENDTTVSVSKYDYSEYFLVDDRNEPVFEEIAKEVEELERIEKMKDEVRNRIREHRSRLHLKSLHDIKKELQLINP